VLVIRLAREGSRKKPFYRVVLLEKSAARNGRSLEILGTYNPVPNPAHIELKADRIAHWTARGAQMSATVGKLLERHHQRAAAATTAA
jgi:small subunit ribosomal protein S16